MPENFKGFFDSHCVHVVYTQKNRPARFNCTVYTSVNYYTFLSTLDCQFSFNYLQVLRSYAILSATSVSADGGHFEHENWIAPALIRH